MGDSEEACAFHNIEMVHTKLKFTKWYKETHRHPLISMAKYRTRRFNHIFNGTPPVLPHLLALGDRGARIVR